MISLGTVWLVAFVALGAALLVAARRTLTSGITATWQRSPALERSRTAIAVVAVVVAIGMAVRGIVVISSDPISGMSWLSPAIMLAYLLVASMFRR